MNEILEKHIGIAQIDEIVGVIMRQYRLYLDFTLSQEYQNILLEYLFKRDGMKKNMAKGKI